MNVPATFKDDIFAVPYDNGSGVLIGSLKIFKHKTYSLMYSLTYDKPGKTHTHKVSNEPPFTLSFKSRRMQLTKRKKSYH